MKPQKMMFFPLAMHHNYSTMNVIHNHYLPSELFTPLYTWKKKKMEKRTSKPFCWMMNIGPLKKFLTDHYVYTDTPLPHGLCPYPCPYSDYQASSYYDSMDLSDISEFKDLMTTSSGEDVLALDDIEY